MHAKKTRNEEVGVEVLRLTLRCREKFVSVLVNARDLPKGGGG